MPFENLPNNHFNSINDFIIAEDGKPLGSGSFGIVCKAWHKRTNKMYAIKIVKLESNITETELLLLSREIFIHYRLDHPHIIKLWAAILQDKKIYMIMDYAENGNLFCHLRKNTGLSQYDSFRIFFQVVEAIEYMHKMDVFHRDLKPENILLDQHMNVKICDFGWVADELTRPRNTFCGTYEYMAPQMVSQISYDYRIDIWALGVLLFELNHAKAPFQADCIQKMQQRLQNGVYEVKKQATQPLRDLISALLKFEPQQRLQLRKIKQSEWAKINQEIMNINLMKQLACITTPDSNPNTELSTKTSSKIRKKQLTKNTFINNSLNIRAPVMEDDRKRKHHRKYKTMEQELCQLTTNKNQNLKTCRHHYKNSPSLIPNASKPLSRISQNVCPVNLLATDSNSGSNQQTIKKTKTMKMHARTETYESTANPKATKIRYFQLKSKLSHDCNANKKMICCKKY